MSAPRWAGELLSRLAPPGAAEDVLGDLEEAHRRRVARHGQRVAAMLTGLDAMDMAIALLRERMRRRSAASQLVGPEVAFVGGRTTGASVSWLDVKLGLRMLVKYPGLTLVGGLGMAVAIVIGACFFAVLYSYLQPTVPLDEGERVVGIELWDAAASNQEPRSLHDFVTWRAELKSVEDVGAFRTVYRNLITPERPVESVRLAEITASGFRLARVPALLGRSLVPDDEREGAPHVVVIGYDAWRMQFASDPAVVGRSVRLGTTTHTVVGVMPEGFAFPMNHRFWTPLRAEPSAYERRQGPELTVFGRLAPGATLDAAQAELMMVGQRTASAFPATHAQLRPRIMPYTALFMDGTARWELHLIQLLVSMLLVVICVNVAILVYARTATRRSEIAVRSALGASRRRIVAQLFIEALVLSAGAAAVGLGLASLILRQVDAAIGRELAHFGGAPFWMNFGLSFGTVLYVLALTVLAAVLVGVVPALKATGHRLQSGLRQLGGGTGMLLGRTWTVLIVAQVAFAVAVLPAAVFSAWTSLRYGTAEPGFAAEEFLTARLEMDQETPLSTKSEAHEREIATRYGNLQSELVRRLESVPSVSEVTFTQNIPGQEPGARIEVDGMRSSAATAYDSTARPAVVTSHEVGFARVDIRFFDAFGVPILTGRRFTPGDLGAAAATVIVNRAFVQQFLGGGSALGRRIRYDSTGGGSTPQHVEVGRWYEIVGVVDDFPATAMEQPGVARGTLYYPLALGQVHPVNLAVRVRGTTPAAFAPQLREITTALDPTLQLRETRPMDEVMRSEQGAMRLAALALGLVTVSVLLLSAAGIYALMSFTVAQRRREIGVRSALGADPRQILGSVFSRALRQLVVGLVVGAAAAAMVDRLTGGELMGGQGAILLPGVSMLMLVVGLLAAVGPARRGLRIQPTEALRADA